MSKDHVVGTSQMGIQVRASLLDSDKPKDEFNVGEIEGASAQLPLNLGKILGQTGNVTGGGLVDYYLIEVKHPQRDVAPYVAECDDIIEALKLSFDEGEIFKEIWRTACARLGTGKPGNTLIRSREKILHRAKRLMKQAKNSL